METAFNNMFSHIKYRLKDGDFWQSNAVISDLKIAKGYFLFLLHDVVFYYIIITFRGLYWVINAKY